MGIIEFGLCHCPLYAHQSSFSPPAGKARSVWERTENVAKVMGFTTFATKSQMWLQCGGRPTNAAAATATLFRTTYTKTMTYLYFWAQSHVFLIKWTFLGSDKAFERVKSRFKELFKKWHPWICKNCIDICIYRHKKHTAMARNPMAQQWQSFLILLQRMFYRQSHWMWHHGIFRKSWSLRNNNTCCHVIKMHFSFDWWILWSHNAFLCTSRFNFVR